MDGSIHERINFKGKKVYDVSFRVVDPKTGKKKQVLKRGFKKKGDAQEFLNETQVQVKNNLFVSYKKMTLGEFIGEWFSRFVEGKLAHNTVSGYRVNVYKHIIPNIGGIPLQKLSVRDIQNFYDTLHSGVGNESSGLSAKTIIYIHRNLSKALDYAVKENMII